MSKNGKDLKKLSRIDMLELLLEQETEIERLQKELDEAKQKLEDRQIELESVGSIAEAVIKVNKVYELAERSANEYLENVERKGKERMQILEKQEAEYKERIERMLIETIKYCDEMKAKAKNGA